MPNSNFLTIFSILLNILPVSVYIYLIITITWNLADVWHTIFSSDPPNILSRVGIGIGYKIVFKLKFCAQSMHLIYAIKNCFHLKLVDQNKNELPGKFTAFRDDTF